MQMQKVRTAFEKKGYPSHSFINKKQCFRILNAITPGGQFHQQVANQLWAQATSGQTNREIRIDDFCMTLVQAQNILKSRISQTNEKISMYQSEKRRLQSAPSRDNIRKIQEIDNDLDELYAQKQSFEDDFRLVTQPFGIQLMGSVLKNYNTTTGPSDFGFESNYNAIQQKYKDHTQSDELKFLFYLTLAFGFIEIIVIYGKYDFLNLIVLTCLLSIYLMNFFDRVYIRFTLSLIVISIVLDLVWMIMYASQHWNPPEVGNHSSYQTGYLRFIVFFTAVLMLIKMGLGFFLFRHWNTSQDDKYMVSLGLITILLNANRSNPISKGLTSAAVSNY